jgi:hypothetical protein
MSAALREMRQPALSGQAVQDVPRCNSERSSCLDARLSANAGASAGLAATPASREGSRAEPRELRPARGEVGPEILDGGECRRRL